MATAQFFGIMPVINILARDVSQIHFKWMSLRTMYVLFCCSCLAIYDVFTIAWMMKEGVEFSRIVTVIFYTSNMIAGFCFLQLSIGWPKIIRRWQATEDLMSPLLKDQSQRSLKIKLQVLAIVILLLSLSESKLFVYLFNINYE